MATARRSLTASKPRPAALLLPMSRAEMTALGWDEWDIVLVTGDAHTAGDEGGRRPDRCTILYTQRGRGA